MNARQLFTSEYIPHQKHRGRAQSLRRLSACPDLSVLRRSVGAFLTALTVFGIGTVFAQTPSDRRVAPLAQGSRGIGVKTTGPTPSSAAGREIAGELHPDLIVQTGHLASAGLAKIIFSPDGRLIATTVFGSNDVRVWEIATGRELRVFRTGGELTDKATPAVVFSGDGRLMAVAGGDGVIKVLEVLNGRETLHLVADGSPLKNDSGARLLALDGTGNTLVSIDESMQAWYVKTGREQSPVPSSSVCMDWQRRYLPAQNASFAFHPDGSQLLQVSSEPGASSNKSGIAQITDPSQWGLNDFKGRVLAQFIDVASGCKSRSFELPGVKSYEGLSVAAASYTADGEALVAGLDGQKLKLWEVGAGGSPRVLAEVPDRSRPALSFSPGGRFLTVSDGLKIRTWEVPGGRELSAINTPFGTAAGPTGNHAVAISPDGQWVAAGGAEHSLTVWSASTGKLARRIGGTGNLAYEVAFTADGSGLLSGGRTRWDLKEGAAVRLASEAHASYVIPSPGGALAAGIGPRGEAVIVTETGTGRRLHTLIAPDNLWRARRLAFGAAGRILVTLYTREGHTAKRKGNIAGGMVKLWEVKTGRELHTFFCPIGVESARISDDGRYLAVADQRAGVTIWDLRSGVKLHTFNSNVGRDGISPPEAIQSTPVGRSRKGEVHDPKEVRSFIVPVAFSPDGDLLVTGAIIWDVAAGQILDTLPLRDGSARQVAFSGDGRLLAIGTADNLIKVFDLRAKREAMVLSGHVADINSLAFSPDGTFIASASDDGHTYLWDRKTGEHLATLVSLFDGGEWLVITPDGLFDGTPASWNQILWRYDADTFNVAPVEWFFNEYYYPGLLSEVFAGKRPKAAQSFALRERRQPQLRLTTDAGGASPGAPVSARTVRVKIDISEAADSPGGEGSGARDVRLFRNGSLVKAWRGDVLGGRPDTTLEADVTLVAGENRLTAYAFNRDNVKSRDATLAVTGGEGLRRAGVAYVLAVGVNEYANPQYDLRFAVADAREFAAEVSRQQGRLRRFTRTEVVELLDRDATKANILEALRRLAGGAGAPSPGGGVPQSLRRLKPAEPEDSVIIYFAGHGTAQRDRFYLIPHDLGYAGGRDEIDDGGLRQMLAHSISDEELEGAVERIDAGQLLMVIDACNSGQALESEERRRGPMNSRGLAQLAYEKGMYVLTAAQSYQAALEAPELGHGLLTYALVQEGLRTAAADASPRDGEIFAREWFTYAVKRVPHMQLRKIADAQEAGVDLFFREEERGLPVASRSGQQPRLFYRRETEANHLLIARHGAG